MKQNYFIGIDIGTTGTKVVLINTEGKVKATTLKVYKMTSPFPLWSEQNPKDWWQSVKKGIKELLFNVDPKDIKGIGLTGQMHGLVVLDKNKNVLYPCIMWNDQRTGTECQEITNKIGFKNLLSITGNPVLPGFTAPKIIWLKKNKPEIFEKIDKLLLPKDYIRYKLTNEFYTDVSDASGTSLLNVKERNWSKEIIDKLEIPFEWLPDVVESIEQTGTITKHAAEMTGLIEGIPVIAGGGDQAAGAIGAGAVKEGVLSIVLGTSGVVFTHSNKFRIAPEGKLHAFCHSVPYKWHLMGVTLSAAGSLQWYKNFLFNELKRNYIQKNVYEILTDEASKILPGSEGLFFLPYLSGERTPYSDPDAKGCFIGITLRHKRAHFTRAVLEGVSYSINDCYQLINDLGIETKKIIISGGGAKSKLWQSIISDLFGLEIHTLSCKEGAPYGAAILASVGTGYYSDVNEACNNILKIDSTIKPNKNNNILYNEFYSIYRELYPNLKSPFKNISKKVQKYYGN